MIPEHIQLLSLEDIGCMEEVPENQLTIAGNAIQKAQFIKDRYGFDCFADDTGLEVKALNGEPGVFSARYAGPQRNADDNMDKLMYELAYKNDRSAQFRTVIALILNNKLTSFEGVCEGKITKIKKGKAGFGYDPVFKPDGHDQTFAEMELGLKNKISHRSKAVLQLIEFLQAIK